MIPTPENVPLVVPDVLNPRYSYGGSKLAAELIAINYGRTGFDRVVVFRPHNVYGPDMGFEHVIPEFTLRAAAAGIAASSRRAVRFDFRIKGDGRQTRAFIHHRRFHRRSCHRDRKRASISTSITSAIPKRSPSQTLAQLIFAQFGREPSVRP